MRDMDAIYVPGDPPRNEFGQLLLAKDPLAYERNYQFDITPVSDNRPFFFYTVQPRDVAAFLLQTGARSADVKVNVAVPKLFSAHDCEHYRGRGDSAAAAAGAWDEAAAGAVGASRSCFIFWPSGRGTF